MKKIVIITSTPIHKNYPKEAFEVLSKVEKKHFWFTTRNRIIEIILNRFIQPSTNRKFLEIGCGSGIVMTHLEKMGFSVTGLDIHMEGLKLAKKKTKAKLIHADILKTKIKKKYDVVGLFDVIEHSQDDVSFLEKSGHVLKTKGKIILTVPANMGLWSRIDQISSHKRRYTKQSLNAMLKKAGYEIEFVSYFNFLLYIPQLIFRKLSNQKIEDKEDNVILSEQLKVPHPLINITFGWVSLLEAQLLRITSIPIGTSLIIVGHKKSYH